MASELNRKVLLKDGSDNDFVVYSAIEFEGEPFCGGEINFPDYQSARKYYDYLVSCPVSHEHEHHDYIKEDLEKAIADSK